MRRFAGDDVRGRPARARGKHGRTAEAAAASGGGRRQGGKQLSHRPLLHSVGMKRRRPMFIPPHSVSQPQLVNRHRPAPFRRAPSESFLPNNYSHPSTSLCSLRSTFVISDAVAAVAAATDAYDASDAILSTSDIVVGTIMAFVLAFGWSFLNGQSTSSNFISWQSQLPNNDNDKANISEENSSTLLQVEGEKGIDSDVDGSNNGNVGAAKVFNAENWKEMSREENYVLYNTRVRAEVGRERRGGREDSSTRTDTEDDTSIVAGARNEKKWVLVALLVLFVPIFSVEFFFALSRQFMCQGNFLNQSEWSQVLCSPYTGS